MSDMTIGATERADAHEQLQAMIEQAQQASGPLEARMEAALAVAIEAKIADIQLERTLGEVQDEKAIDAVIDEQTADRGADEAVVADDAQAVSAPSVDDAGTAAVEPDGQAGATAATAGLDAGTDQAASADQGAEAARQAAEAVTQVSNILREAKDDLVSHIADLAMMGQPELDQFMKDLVSGVGVEAIVDASTERLAGAAEETSFGISLIADAIHGAYPADLVDTLEDHIRNTVSTMIDADLAQKEAFATLDIDPATGPQTPFEAALAGAVSETLLAEQEKAALSAIGSDLDALPQNSVARRVGAAMVSIAEAIPAGDPVLRAAIRDFYDDTVERGTVRAGSETLDRLLAADEPLVADTLRANYPSTGYDPRIADAVSTDPATRAAALADLASPAPEVDRQRESRMDPFGGLDPALAARMAAAEIFDAVQGAVRELDTLTDAIAFHAEGRMGYAAATLEAVASLVASGAVAQDAEVVIGRAEFQVGTGRQVHDTQAAHRLAGQLHFGVDEATLDRMTQEERAPYRLDTLLDDDHWNALTRTLAASTQVLPSHVNRLDSALERLGFREGLAEAAQSLVDGTAETAEAAFETFREAALEALDAAYEEAEAKLEAHRQRSAQDGGNPAGGSMAELDLELRLETARIYSEAFVDASMEAARERLKHHRNDDS